MPSVLPWGMPLASVLLPVMPSVLSSVLNGSHMRVSRLKCNAMPPFLLSSHVHVRCEWKCKHERGGCWGLVNAGIPWASCVCQNANAVLEWCRDNSSCHRRALRKSSRVKGNLLHIPTSRPSGPRPVTPHESWAIRWACLSGYGAARRRASWLAS